MPDRQRISSEQLAYWYLRLNGFLSIPNFVVHPDRGAGQRTDVDVMGVRFPFRKENVLRPMEDDDFFRQAPAKPLIILAEVKGSLCRLNGPWTEPSRGNMQRVLAALGVFPEEMLEIVSTEIYSTGRYEDNYYQITLACFGAVRNDIISNDYPNVPQFLWPGVLSFIYRRFSSYRRQKADHNQWDDVGKCLWDVFENSRTGQQYSSRFEIM